MSMSVVVIGGGIMGLSVARSLSGRGHDVTVLERGSTPNPSASSFDEQRLIRYAYGSMAGYAAMVGDAYRAWDRLWEELGRVLYRETGTLALAGPGGLWVGETAGTLEAMGIGAEWLSPEGLESRYPLLATEGVERALYLPTGGILFASRILEGLAGGLRRAGVVVRDRTEAVEVDPARSEVRSAAGDRFGADAIVVATGAWAPRLLPALAPRLRPSRQVGLYLAPPADLAPAWAAMPMVLDLDPEGGFYAVPPVAGTRMKTGDHRFSLSGDPALPEPAGDDELAPLLSTCSARLRDFHRFREAGRWSCFYAVADGERFIVERPDPGLWVLAGFSGHGFKFGPLIGEWVASALDGELDPGELTRRAAGATPAVERGSRTVAGPRGRA